MKPKPRPIYEIAADIIEDWPKPYFAAVPYINAMRDLNVITDNYMCDSGRSVLIYFLGNATTWRGETARTIKKELKSILNIK